LLQALFYLLTRLFNPPFGLNKLFYGNIIISLSLSLLIITLYAFKIAHSTQMAIVGALILTLSKAYIDYSTSGLENPLSHFLTLCFLGLFLFKKEEVQHNVLGLAFLAGLGILNRMDMVLIFFPALLLVIWQSAHKPKTIFTIFIGVLPVILWEIFSVFYYGAPFPNTAIAKLNTGIDKLFLFKQGVHYFFNSLRLDSITLITIAFSLAITILSRNGRRIAVAMGIGLYLCYILYIGGDFMSGRFFSLPLLAAVILLATFDLKSLPLFGGCLILVLGIGLLPFITTIERRPTYGQNRENNLVFLDSHKIADERLVYADRTGLLAAIQYNSPRIIYSQDDWLYSATYPREVNVYGPVGINGLRDGPDIHVIDKNGLIDPLMARLPLEDTQNWRIGHFHHIIPAGYEETLASGTNQIENPDIALFYAKLSIVVKGPLWDWNRVVEIWNLNTKKYNSLPSHLTVLSQV
jgi:arabinofuranosyltransferase